jgi:polysaccharide biosynthesis transport protein
MNQAVLAVRTVAPTGSNENEVSRISISWLINVLRDRMAVILGATALTTLLSIIYILLAPPTYVATAWILIDDQKPRVMNTPDIVSNLRFDLGVPMLSQVIDSQIALIRSPDMAEYIIRSQSLYPAVAGKPNAPIPEIQIKNFLDDLSARRMGLTFIIAVSYTNKSRDRASEIANAVANAYIDQQVRAKNKTKTEATDWLRRRVGELNAQVRDEASRIEEYKVKAGLVSLGTEFLKEREVSKTMDRLIELRAEASGVEARLKMVESLAKDPEKLNAVAPAMQSAVITEHRKQHATLSARLAQTISRMGDAHPDVRTIRAEMRDVEEAITKEISRAVESLRNDAEVARSQAEMQLQQLVALKGQLLNGTNEIVQLREMELNSKSTRDLYSLLLTRLKESEVQTSLENPDARIITAAKAPEKASWPVKSVVLAGGLLSGLLISTALVLMQEYSQGTVRSIQDLINSVGIPHVASLPAEGLEAPQLWHEQAARHVFPAWRTVEDNPPVRHALDNLSSPYAEAVFSIKQFAAVGAAGAGKVIAVVSARPGEGKTSTALNLADYVSGTGQKVLLVDGDLRQATLTHLLCPQGAHQTLADVTSGRGQSEDVFVTDALSGFRFCPARAAGAGERPMEVLASQGMATLLDNLRQTYEAIIIDTSPILEYVDARALLEHVDVVLIVVERGRTTRDDLNETLAFLPSGSRYKKGLVFNRSLVPSGPMEFSTKPFFSL